MSGKGKNTKMTFSSARTRHLDEETEITECKEKAIKLLLAKLDGYTHAIIDGDDDEEIEVWESSDWKYSPVAVAASGKEGDGEGLSVGSGKIGGKRDSSWFSKN